MLRVCAAAVLCLVLSVDAQAQAQAQALELRFSWTPHDHPFDGFIVYRSANGGEYMEMIRTRNTNHVFTQPWCDLSLKVEPQRVCFRLKAWAMDWEGTGYMETGFSGSICTELDYTDFVRGQWCAPGAPGFNLN